MAKRTNRVAWWLTAVLAVVVLGGCGWYAVAQSLSIRQGFRQWSLDEHLRDAVLRGDLSGVRVLLAQGADSNARNEQGSTALHIAARSNRPDVVSVLLRHGARVNVTNWYGETPLMGAADVGSLDLVRLLLLHGAVAYVQDREGGTALTRAVSTHRPAVVRLLKEAVAKK